MTGDPPDPPDLQGLLDGLVASGAPGAAARLVDEHGSHEAASGSADLSTGRAMRPELHFRAGSVTKSFVATVVLQLVAEGRMSLADTVEPWLPGILPYGGEITVHQLLNHTAGVPHNWEVVERAQSADPQGWFRHWDPRELVAVVADRPPTFRPGTAWSYSNTGYTLLGLMVEAAEGVTLGETIGRRIVGPLGLAATSLPVDEIDIPAPKSCGYRLPRDDDGRVLAGPLVDVTLQNPSYTWAAGALVSSLADLTRTFGALLRGELVPPRLLAEMLRTVAVPRGSIPYPLFDRYGLGLVEVQTPAGPLFGQPGGIPGFLSMVLATRDGGRQFAVMINIGEIAPPPVLESLLRAFRVIGTRLVEGPAPAPER
jgi:D-alanyl-D-alanine carboxypeptidase